MFRPNPAIIRFSSERVSVFIVRNTCCVIDLVPLTIIYTHNGDGIFQNSGLRMTKDCDSLRWEAQYVVVLNLMNTWKYAG